MITSLARKLRGYRFKEIYESYQESRPMLFESNVCLNFTALHNKRCKVYLGKNLHFTTPYNRRETRVKRPLGKDPNRSWCHLHASVKLSWPQPMDIGGTIRVCCRSVHGFMCCDQESFTLVWRQHQLLSGSLHNGRLY